MIEGLSQNVKDYWEGRTEVTGAFPDLDFALFDLLLSHQKRRGECGDLLEIGALYGASAIVLGLHAGGDTTVVCDLFDSGKSDEAVTRENRESYPGLTQQAFEANYRTWVATSPQIIAEPSNQIRNYLADRSLRFVHIDGSHLYDVVVDDLRNTHALLADTGIAVLDDYRQMHTPGVAAAAWAAVANDGFVPFCLSEQKMYGTWDPAVAVDLVQTVRGWAIGQERAVRYGRQRIAGREVILLEQKPQPPAPVPVRALRRMARALGKRPASTAILGDRHLGVR